MFILRAVDYQRNTDKWKTVMIECRDSKLCGQGSVRPHAYHDSV